MGVVVRFHPGSLRFHRRIERPGVVLIFHKPREVRSQLGSRDAGALDHDREDAVIDLAGAGLPSPNGGLPDADQGAERLSAHRRVLPLAEGLDGVRVFHEPDIAKLEMRVSREKLPTWQKTWEPTGHTLAGMAKMTGHTPAIRIRGAARQHLYIQEWMKHLGVSDERLAQRLGVTTPTVWKRRTQQHRLNPGKIAEIAHALGIKPTDLWRPPEPSEPPQGLDSRVRDVPQALREIAHAHANAAIDAVLKSAMAAKKTGT